MQAFIHGRTHKHTHNQALHCSIVYALSVQGNTVARAFVAACLACMRGKRARAR